MAAIVRHVLRKTGQQFSTKYDAVRFYASSSGKHKESRKLLSRTASGTRIDSAVESIASKGFLRSHKPYLPPQNVQDLITTICKTNNMKASDDYQFSNLEEKSHFLNSCFEAFKHGVPNSQLHEINSIADVIQFYNTTVDTTLPMDELKKIDLPENLHILDEYKRFHPEDDTMFGGKTAFPKSSTLVTGLKYKKKYKGHTAKTSWP